MTNNRLPSIRDFVFSGLLRYRQETLTAWSLVLPAGLLCTLLLGAPIIMTFVLSFYTFSYTHGIEAAFTPSNYITVLTSPYYLVIFGRTFMLGVIVTAICAVLGTSEAYILSRMSNPWRSFFLLIALSPLLVSVVVRTLGWMLLFGGNGVLKRIALALHLVTPYTRVSLTYTTTGITIALVHVLVPFMLLSVWTALRQVDMRTEDAAISLGASRFTALRRVVIPQLIPGILSGSIIVFALTTSAFATPSLIGGRRIKVVATLTYQAFLSTMNWPLGASVAILLLVANITIIMMWNRLLEQRYRKKLGQGV